ncbi:reverse transcriptase domain-containing protein [Tanacetum coccineum]
MSMGQDRQMQMVGSNGGNQFRQYAGQNVGNQNGYNAVQNVRNQIANQNPNRNGNVVATRAEGNAIGNNADLDKNKEVNANCILMSNLQRALTSGTQTDKAPIYDSDGSAEGRQSLLTPNIPKTKSLHVGTVHWNSWGDKGHLRSRGKVQQVLFKEVGSSLVPSIGGKTGSSQSPISSKEMKREAQDLLRIMAWEQSMGNFAQTFFGNIFEQEEWPMPVWCKMFCQTLSGSTWKWFDSLDPKSVDGYEELSNKFLEEFSQQKRYDKDPTEIHGIKRKRNEGLQAFMDRFKAESAHIKGVPLVLRISTFMHGHGHPELAKKLNDKIPKIVDEIWERVRAFIRGETAADTSEVIRSPRREGFTPLTKTPKEILAMDNGHNTDDCYHLKKQIKEAVALGRLAHPVKDIRQSG